MKDNLYKEFRKIFNKEAENAYFSPGRVNLIGEHIDYNGGLVMPCAITFGTYLLIAPNNDNVLRFRSLNFDESLEVELKPGLKKNNSNWYNYPLGVFENFLEDGHQLRGL